MIECLAVHRLVVDPPAKPHHIGAATAGQLDPATVDRLTEYVDNMQARIEPYGQAQAGWWSNGEPAEFASLRSCPVADYDQESRNLLKRLADKTPATAQSGLILFIRSVIANDARTLTCLKMQLTSEHVLQFEDTAPVETAIRVAAIENILPQATQLKKAALIPHPDGTADLRVVDEQLKEPANYWLDFLGALARPKEPTVVRNVVNALIPSLVQCGIDRPAAAQAVGTALDEIPEGAAEAPEEFVRRAARSAGLEAPADIDAVWNSTSAAAPVAVQRNATISREAAERATTTVTIDDVITIRGPSHILDPRLRIVPADGGNGWQVRITARTEPIEQRTGRPPGQ